MDAVFLHQIRRLLAGTCLAVMLLGGCARVDGQRAPSPAVGALAEVVAATGDPSDDAVAAVRRAVAEQEGALVTLFHGKPDQRFFVHVHASRGRLPESLAANLHEDSPGFALLGAHQIHLVWDEMRRTGASLRGVVVHEMVHELLDQFVAPNGRLIPRWFHEGLAQSIAGDTYLGAREDELAWRVSVGGLIPFGELRQRFPAATEELRLAYAQSYSYVAWLTRRFGLESLLAIAAATDDLTSFERALYGRTRTSPLDLETAWKDYVVQESGAPWRVALDQCFSLLLIASLPVLVLALMRRLAVDRRAAEQLARSEAESAPFPEGGHVGVDEMTNEQRRSEPGG